MSAGTLTSHAARGGAVTLAFQAVKIAAMLASIVILGRLLAPADFGLFAMIIAIVGVAEIFRDFGLSVAALQARTLSQQQQSNLFWLNAAIGAALSLLVFGASWGIAAFYGRPELVAIGQVLSVVFVLNGAATQHKVVINRRLQFVRLSLTDVGPYAVALGAAIVAATHGYGVWALVVQQLVAAVVTLALACVFSRWLPSLPRRVAMDGLVGFGWRVAVTQIVGYATRNVDAVAIGQVWGATPLGFYDRAFQIVMMPINQINAPLSRVAVPTLGKVRDDDERFTRALRRAQAITLFGVASVFGVLVGVGDLVVAIVLGPGWELTGLLVRILAVGAIFRALAQVCYWIYIARGLASEQMRYFLVAQPVLALVVLAGLPGGVVGVASTYAGGLAVYWAVSLWWACRKSGISAAPFIGDVARVLLLFTAPAAVASAGAAYLAASLGSIAAVAVGVLAAAACWTIVALVSSRIRDDLRGVAGIARSIVARKG